MGSRVGSFQVLLLPALLAGAACNRASPSDVAGAGHIVELASVAVSPNPIQCRGGGMKQLYFNVVMENTTAQDVHVVRISSTGLTVRASRDSLAGRQVFIFDSLPFTPAGATLRALDGQLTYTAIMTTPCVPGGSGGSDYIDIYVILYVWTTTGVYASKYIEMRQLYM
jgi:hypothetical protein